MANEIQQIDFDSVPGAGWFNISFGGETTSNLAYNANDGDVQSALEALTSIGSGNIAVTGDFSDGFTLTFQGSLANTNVAQVTVFSTLAADGAVAANHYWALTSDGSDAIGGADATVTGSISGSGLQCDGASVVATASDLGMARGSTPRSIGFTYTAPSSEVASSGTPGQQDVWTMSWTPGDGSGTWNVNVDGTDYSCDSANGVNVGIPNCTVSGGGGSQTLTFSDDTEHSLSVDSDVAGDDFDPSPSVGETQPYEPGIPGYIPRDTYAVTYGTLAGLGLWALGDYQGEWFMTTDSPNVMGGTVDTGTHRLVYTFDGTTTSIYLDGSLLASATPSTNTLLSGQISFGGIPGYGGYTSGVLAGVFQANWCLDATQAAAATGSAAYQLPIVITPSTTRDGSAGGGFGCVVNSPIINSKAILQPVRGLA